MCPSSSIHCFHYQQVLALRYKESGPTWTSSFYISFLFLGKLTTECSQDLIKAIKHSLPSLITIFPFSTQNSSHHFWKAHNFLSSAYISSCASCTFFLPTLEDPLIITKTHLPCGPKSLHKRERLNQKLCWLVTEVKFTVLGYLLSPLNCICQKAGLN